MFIKKKLDLRDAAGDIIEIERLVGNLFIYEAIILPSNTK